MDDQLPLIYDPRYQTWEDWSSLMVEAYSGQQLQIGVPEDQWKDWASGLMAIDVFQNDAMPNPVLYEDWQGWATAMIGAISPRN
jgi:hypothetical protein